VHQIESDLFGRRGKALTNFDRKLPAPQSELAAQMLKDPYNLDFPGLSEDVAERELERGLLDHLEKSLMSLASGLHLSAGSIGCRSADRASTLTCCSITFG
jgi:predicted nuclease of restriction endonuclease-like (RecB) superfamily